MTSVPCTGCLKPLGELEQLSWDVCLNCTKARHRTVLNRGVCKCGRKKRPGPPVATGGYLVMGHRHGVRRWIPCERCLGTIPGTKKEVS